MQRGIAYSGLLALAVCMAGCQPILSFNMHRPKSAAPSQSIDSLIPQQTPATGPARPLPEDRSPAMLATHDVPPQPKDQYAPPTKSPRVHTVQAGDTLFSIARQYYGDSRQWRRIYQANKNRIQDPQSVRVGMKLIVP